MNNKKIRHIYRSLLILGLIGLTACGTTEDPTVTPTEDPTTDPTEDPTSDECEIVFNVDESEFGDGKNSRTTLTFWNPITGDDSGYMQELVQAWNNKFGKSFKISTTSNAEASHYEKIDIALNNNTAPDIAIVHTDRLAYYQYKGVIRDLTSWKDNMHIYDDDYVNDTLSIAEFDDKLYAVPYDYIPTLLYYNKELIPSGYTEEDILSSDFTVDKMIEMAKKAYVYNTKESKITYGISFNYSYTEKPFLNFLYQQGGKVISSSNDRKAAYACEEGYNAATALMNMPTTKVDDHKIAQDSGVDHINIFAQGRALFTIDGIWSMPSLLKHTDTVDTGLCYLPKVNSSVTRRNTYANAHCFACFSNKSGSTLKDTGIQLFLRYINANSAYWCQSGKVAIRKDTLASKAYTKLEWAFCSDDLTLMDLPEKKFTFNYLIKYLPNNVSILCEGQSTDVKAKIDAAAKAGEDLAGNL